MTEVTIEPETTGRERQRKFIPDLERELTLEGYKETLRALYENQTFYAGKTPHIAISSFSSNAVYYNIDPRFTIGLPGYPAKITKRETELYLKIAADKGYLDRTFTYLTTGAIRGFLGFKVKEDKLSEVEKLLGVSQK